MSEAATIDLILDRVRELEAADASAETPTRLDELLRLLAALGADLPKVEAAEAPPHRPSHLTSATDRREQVSRILKALAISPANWQLLLRRTHLPAAVLKATLAANGPGHLWPAKVIRDDDKLWRLTAHGRRLLAEGE